VPIINSNSPTALRRPSLTILLNPIEFLRSWPLRRSQAARLGSPRRRSGKCAHRAYPLRSMPALRPSSSFMWNPPGHRAFPSGGCGNRRMGGVLSPGKALTGEWRTNVIASWPPPECFRLRRRWCHRCPGRCARWRGTSVRIDRDGSRCHAFASLRARR
jgi:hypothetical protein